MLNIQAKQKPTIDKNSRKYWMQFRCSVSIVVEFLYSVAIPLYNPCYTFHFLWLLMCDQNSIWRRQIWFPCTKLFTEWLPQPTLMVNSPRTHAAHYTGLGDLRTGPVTGLAEPSNGEDECPPIHYGPQGQITRFSANICLFPNVFWFPFYRTLAKY